MVGPPVGEFILVKRGFLAPFKEELVCPPFKKPSPDPSLLNNSYPILFRKGGQESDGVATQKNPSRKSELFSIKFQVQV